MLDDKGANSRAALTFKHLSTMEHQHLVDIRGYIKQDARRRAMLSEIHRSDEGILTNNRGSKASLGGGILRASQSNPFLNQAAEGAQNLEAVQTSKKSKGGQSQPVSARNLDMDEAFHKLSAEEQR